MSLHTLPLPQNPIARVRFVAVSATIPNIQDIAEWLGVPAEGVQVFGERGEEEQGVAWCGGK